MFIPEFKCDAPHAKGASDLRHLLLYDPSRTRHLLEFTQATLRADGALPTGERELLAAMTSQANHCLF